MLVEDDEFGDYPDFVTLVEAQHGYPATRLQWQPASAAGAGWSNSGKTAGAELLATTGDALRVWEYASDAPPAAGSGYVGRQSGGGHRLTLKTALSGVSVSSAVCFMVAVDWDGHGLAVVWVLNPQVAFNRSIGGVVETMSVFQRNLAIASALSRRRRFLRSTDLSKRKSRSLPRLLASVHQCSDHLCVLAKQSPK